MTYKHTPHTDALDTLGTIIGPEEKRDAIHIAVEPVVAGQLLYRAQEVFVLDGKAYPAAGKGVGIVDPFLGPMSVREGERFWLLLQPGSVRSLRHVWEHPAFPSEEVAPVPAVTKEQAKTWLLGYISKSDCPDFETIESVLRGHSVDDGMISARIDDNYFAFIGTDAHGDIPSVFWDMWEVYLGYNLKHRPASFTCGC